MWAEFDLPETTPTGEAVLSVEDEGAGIPEDERSLVFEAFHRGSESRGESQGAGLGLAIARRIAQGHGGSLELVPSRGEGCRFEKVICMCWIERPFAGLADTMVVATVLVAAALVLGLWAWLSEGKS